MLALVLWHSNKEDEEKQKKMGGQERGGEECPGVLQQPFVLARPVSVGFACMTPPLIG